MCIFRYIHYLILNINKTLILTGIIFTKMDFDTINEIRSFVHDDDQLFFEQVCRAWSFNGLHTKGISNVVTPTRSDSQLVEVVPYLTLKMEEKVITDLAFKGRLSSIVAINNCLEIATRVPRAIHFAARGGHLDIIRWFQSKGVKIDISACNGAAWGGHMDLIFTLEKEGIESRDLLLWCILGGELEAFKELRLYGYCIPTNRRDYVCEMASEKGYLVFLQYLVEEEEYECDVSSYIQAAINGHIDIIRYLVDNLHRPDLLDDLDILGAAVQYGQFEITQYLLEDGFPVNEYIMHQASMGGNLEIVKYLHEYGCPWDSSVYTGNIEIMKYAYQEGCPLNEYACDFVASRGDITALKFLREHDCPWWENTVMAAYDACEFLTVLYLRENGCPHPDGIPVVFCP